MKRHVLTAILTLHAMAWCAATVQGVSLQIGPSGISPDAFLFGTVFGAVALGSAVLAWAVHRRKRAAILVATTGFGLIGVGGTLLGFPVMLMGIGAADSYVMPLGILALVLGALHLGAAWLGWSVAKTVDPELSQVA